MKRIGDIAARLVANPIELVAAANQKRSTEFVDGSPNEGVTSEPSRRSVEVSTTRATRMGKEAGAGEAPASSTGGTAADRRTATLRLVSNRCLGTASPAAASGRTPRPVVPRHLVLVSGGHAASG